MSDPLRMRVNQNRPFLMSCYDIQDKIYKYEMHIDKEVQTYLIFSSSCMFRQGLRYTRAWNYIYI